MLPDDDQVSQTIPRRSASREAQRVPVLLLVGSGTSVESLRAARLVLVGDGLEMGRKLSRPDGNRALTLPDRTVSSSHARITRSPTRPDGFDLTDLDSTNGTFVDGQRITGTVPLQPGALLFVGSQVMVFRTVTPSELSAIEEDNAPLRLVAEAVSPGPDLGRQAPQKETQRHRGQSHRRCPSNGPQRPSAQ